MLSGTSTRDKRGELLPAIETTLELAKSSVAGLGIIGLEAAIGGLLSVVTALKNMRGNEENLISFRESVQRFCATITHIREVAAQANGGTAPRDLGERIASFVKDLEAMTARAKELQRAGIGRKFLLHKEYASVVNQLNNDLNRAIQDFMMKGGAATEAAVEAGFSATRSDIKIAQTELSNEIAAISKGMYRTQLGVQDLTQRTSTLPDQVAMDFAKILQGFSNDLRLSEAVATSACSNFLAHKPVIIHGLGKMQMAALKAHERKYSKKFTTGLVMKIQSRLKSFGSVVLLGSVNPQSLIPLRRKQTVIVASARAFFFSRDEADRQNPHLVYPTIASQLARLDPDLKRLIVAAVEDDHEIGTLVPRKQFEKLIYEPLTAWRGAKGTIVIVMDALDECSPESGAEEILVRWAAELPKIRVPLRILITSRPEFHIRRKFQTLSLRTISQPYILHDIENSVVREDIELFLRHRLTEIAREHGIQTPWPTEPVLKTLVERAGILFIFASTVVKFIQTGKRKSPETRLELLQKDGTSKGGSQYRDIDALYMQVLQYALSANDEDDEDNPQENMQDAFVSSNQSILAKLMENICDVKLLVWVETLSLLGEVDSAIMSLQVMQDWYK
ncbi:hypothetical protein FS837_003970, partial [Tulasnella sp. UAMH 9824]